MKNKTKLTGISKFMLRSIIEESKNDLILSLREKIFVKKFIKLGLAVIFLIAWWIVPVITVNNHFTNYKNLVKENVSLKTREAHAEPVKKKQVLKEKQLFNVVDEFKATVYAYNSFESQTDGDPCTGAFGYICDKTNVVANNCYLPGTIVEIDGIKYKVYDRMNARYGCDVFDIYMGMDYDAARNWGKKELNVKILRFVK